MPSAAPLSDVAAENVEDPARAAKRKEIEERVRLAKEQQAREAQNMLTKDEIVAKLNTVPVFVVLNGDENAVSLKDDATDEESIFWHIEPASAKAHLEVIIRESPSVAGLHLGAMSLGVALPLAAGWTGAALQSHAGDAGGATGVLPPTVGHKIVFADEVAGVAMPVFLCDQLQTQQALPVFFNRRDLAAAWMKSGRPKEVFTNENLMVIDLRRFIDDMQTGKYDLFSTVTFVPSGAAVAVLANQQRQNEQAQADGAEPPPLA